MDSKKEVITFTFDKAVYERMLSSLMFISSYSDDKYYRLKKDYPKSAACWSGISTSSQFVLNAFNHQIEFHHLGFHLLQSHHYFCLY